MKVDPQIYERPLELLQYLIRFDTTNPPGRTVECIDYIDLLLKSAGYQTTILGMDTEHLNLITRLEGRGEAPPLLLYGHVDVVTAEGQDWTHPPFAGEVADGYLWGRGTLDMKSGVAMFLSAMLQAKAEGLRPAGDVIFAALADEEVGGKYGAEYLVNEHPELFAGVKYALGESGGYTIDIGGQRFYPIQVAEKQGLGVMATVRGTAGHGSKVVRNGAAAKLGRMLINLDETLLPIHITSGLRAMVEAMAAAMPEPTRSDLHKLLDPDTAEEALQALGELEFVFAPLLRNTFNPTIIQGGNAVNVIPSSVTVNCDMRLLPGFTQEDGLVEVRQVVGDEVELKVVYYSPNPAVPNFGMFDELAEILHEVDPDGVPVPYLLSGVTDARFFARLGIQTYGFTPMQLPTDVDLLETVHNADERIPVEAMDFGADMVYKAVQRYQG